MRVISRCRIRALNGCCNTRFGSAEGCNCIFLYSYIARVVNAANHYIIYNIDYRIVIRGNCNFICPHSNRNRCNNCRTTFRNVTSLLDCQRKQMLCINKLCFYSKSVQGNDIVVFKIINTIQVYSCSELVDLFYIRCNKIKPVNRTILGSAAIA